MTRQRKTPEDVAGIGVPSSMLARATGAAAKPGCAAFATGAAGTAASAHQNGAEAPEPAFTSGVVAASVAAPAATDAGPAAPAAAASGREVRASRHVAKLKRQDRLATGIVTAIVVLVMALLVAIVAYILALGGSHLFDLHFLTAKAESIKAGGGIGPQLFNSFFLLVLTLLISVPISLGGAIFLAEYAPENAFTAAVKTAIETLSSLPSIVVGLFGLLLYVQQFGWGYSILSGALALTMFNIPILVRTIQQALEDVPRSQRDAGLALGLTRWETTVHVLLPTAMPAIVTGIVLSAGRVFGEAAALIYTAGQSAPALDFTCLDLSSPTCPWNLFRPAETLAVHIWKINSEGLVPDLDAISNGTAAVLMVCILAFNLIARWAGKALGRKLTAE